MRTRLELARRAQVPVLRQEIVKTEKHQWRIALHAEEELLKRVIAALG